MSTENLREAYAAAVEAQGRDAANLIVTANGGAAGNQGWRSIPPAKVVAAILALESLASRKSETAATTGLDRIRKQAFANMGSPQTTPATPPKTLDADAIFQKWNSAKKTAD